VLRLVPFPLVVTALACGGPGTPPALETGGEDIEVGRSEWDLPSITPVDIVLVVDDSPSMAGEQARLAANLGSFVDILDLPELRLDYRVSVLGSSGSNCGVMAGQPVDTSCRARLDDFDIPAGRESPEASLRDVCENACVHEQVMAPSPWLQSVTDGHWQPNIALPNHEALTCWGLTGVAGCDYESPFENLLAFLDSSEDPESPNFGFVRDDAYLYVLFIGDEDDCSARDTSIFDPNGERVFWPEGVDTDRAPSSVCFRAGATCEDLGDAWDCSSVDRGADGQPTTLPEESVLEPVDTLRERLTQINADKQTDPLGEASWVAVATLAGVTSSGQSAWPKSGPPGFVEEFGAGPGCEIGESAGISPPRISALVDPLGENDHFPTCNDDYTPAFDVFASAGPDQLRPFCFQHCPELQGQRPECIVELERSSGETEQLDECVWNAEGYSIDADTGFYEVPEGQDLCVAYLTDSDGSTESGTDDLSQECSDDGWSLEFAIARRPEDTRVLEGSYVARCVLAEEPDACANN
jgi:hypothetical protein